MPRLYIVIRDGGPWPRNTYVEEDADGFVQATRMHDEDGRARPGGYYGVMLPLSSVRPYVLRIQRGGLDEYARRYEV